MQKKQEKHAQIYTKLSIRLLRILVNDFRVSTLQIAVQFVQLTKYFTRNANVFSNNTSKISTSLFQALF